MNNRLPHEPRVPMTVPPRPTPPPRRTVSSPCISVCRIDPVTGWCEGCLRTLDEIAQWGSMPDEQRSAIWTALPIRRAQRAAGAK